MGRGEGWGSGVNVYGEVKRFENSKKNIIFFFFFWGGGGVRLVVGGGGYRVDVNGEVKLF